jgi:putative N6-adenine-specific DNA methylase
MEELKCFRSVDFSSLRSGLESAVRYSAITRISGSDTDPDALELASRHIRQAGLEAASVPLFRAPLQELVLGEENGVFICNPPYGERLGDQEECRRLYRELRLLKERHRGWRLCAISSDPAFERSYGKRADKKRRLYNGRLECVYYIYY